MASRSIPGERAATEHGSTRILATWGIAGFIAAACAVLIGLETSHILNQRSDILADSRKDQTNLTGSLIQHAELTFRTADAILIAAVERLEHEPPGPEARARLRAWLVEEVRLSSQFLAFSIIDSDGTMIVSSTGREQGQFSDREYFTYHRTHDDDALHIGAPARGRTVDGWLIPVTRRFNHADGTFGGVAVAVINPSYFQDTYDRLELANNSAIALVSLSGPLLVRRPFIEANIGRDMSPSGIFAELKHAPAGTVEMASSTDGVRRLNSYERGHTYPIFISIAQDMTELLVPWKKSALRGLAETAAIALFILLMGAFVWRATRTLAANSVKLRETNAHFDAALANMSNGLSMFDGDGRLMFWNAKYLELYGMSPDVVRQGASIRSIIEHRKQASIPDLDVDACIGEFRQMLVDTGRSTTTFRLKDGRTVSVVNTAIASGGWVGIHEDITERILGEESIFQQATELARTNLRFNAALSNMAQGLCMFDDQKRLVVWNDRFAELYQVPSDLLKIGTPYEAIVTDRSLAAS